VRVNPSKKNAENSESEPQELSFMRPIEAPDPADETPKPTRAERRAAKTQAPGHGSKVSNLRNQPVPNHRNFANRRSG
jgi:hypothetical protein